MTLAESVMTVIQSYPASTTEVLSRTPGTNDYIDPTRDLDLIRAEGRLAELAKLQPGWLDGAGSPIDWSVFQEAQRTILWLIANGANGPRIYPTETGGIRVEWTAGTTDTSVAFEPNELIFAQSVDLKSGNFEEGYFSPYPAIELNNFVLSHLR